MAGWSKLADESALDCLKTLEKLQTNGLLFDLKPGSELCVKGVEQDKIRCLFNQFVSVFLKSTCVNHYLRPLPPMLGDGKSVDLFKLFLVVREKGGYEAVSKNGLWDLVAKEAQIGVGTGSIVKLIYIKYLDTLDKWLQKVHSQGDSESEFKGFLSEINDQNKKGDTNGGMVDDGKQNAILKSRDSRGPEEDDSNRKRKRECPSGLVDWVKRVAKDPCDLAIGCLPEMSRWKSYGTEKLWKQVLLAREAMLVKRNDSSAEQSTWQKQRMHPSMYEDHTGSERSRSSQRILSAKELLYLKSSQLRPFSGSPSSEDHADNNCRKRIPVGSYFQAKVPEWTGETHESDSKWLGTRVWPLGKGEHANHLIERDRIGKGRHESCGCEFPGLIECVRFHVAEKRMKVKLELCLAFERWRFDKMGEEVALAWTSEEEKKFRDTVKPNELFWEDMLKIFPGKTRGELVSYYFNVFLIQRRRYQNGYTPSNIDSDDDEPEIGSESNGVVQGTLKSHLCSPKKVHLNFR